MLVSLAWWGGSQSKPGQGWQGPRTSFAHDGGPVILDGALADAKVGGDVLTGVSRQHHCHNVKLAGR
jgi:hypothetical protein